MPNHDRLIGHKLIELVRSGRSPDELAAEFEPSAQTIRSWVAQADRDAGGRAGGLTSPNARNSRNFEVRITSCALSTRPYQKRRPGSRRRRKSNPARNSNSWRRIRPTILPPRSAACAEGLRQRVLRVAQAFAAVTCARQCSTERSNRSHLSRFARDLWRSAFTPNCSPVATASAVRASLASCVARRSSAQAGGAVS